MAEIACFDSQVTVNHPPPAAAAAAAAAGLTGLQSLLSCCYVMLVGYEVPQPRLSRGNLLLLLHYCCRPAFVKTS